MKTILISDFVKGKYDLFDDSELYIVKNSRDVLYIGISKYGIYYRWFNSQSSHCIITVYGKIRGQSPIGKMIENNLPNSLSWVIQLWTIKDCEEFLTEEKNKHKYGKYWELENFERAMIRKLKPLLNRTYNHS